MVGAFLPRLEYIPCGVWTVVQLVKDRCLINQDWLPIMCSKNDAVVSQESYEQITPCTQAVSVHMVQVHRLFSGRK